jgi:hypothetical protein
MNEDVEASVRSLFGQAKAPDPPPKKTKKVSTHIPYVSAGLAAPTTIFNTITTAAPKTETPRHHVIYYKVPSVDQAIQAPAYQPPITEVDFHLIDCAHLKTGKPFTEKQRDI